MDHNAKSPNTADTLLQTLKQNIAQNDSDKESIAAEEAAAKQSHTTRYKFRVMKREEYLEKKRIADALAAAADDAEISDDELEALLRNYLKNSPTVDPIVEEVPAEEAATETAAASIIDLDQPLSPEEAFEAEETVKATDIEETAGDSSETLAVEDAGSTEEKTPVAEGEKAAEGELNVDAVPAAPVAK